MQPLHIGLAHIDRPSHRTYRRVGYWSYDVPEFIIHEILLPKRFDLRRADYPVDVIVHEDAKTRGEWQGNSPPVCYMIGDSTLSYEHYATRLEQAEQADLLLVDWDQLGRFVKAGVPVVRWNYCVNEHLYYPRPKIHDVGFICHFNAARERMDKKLGQFCNAQGYSYISGKRMGDAYGEALAQCRIVVNLARNFHTRSHRIMDAMACRSAVVTSYHNPVPADGFVAGTHLHYFDGFNNLATIIDGLLQGGRWGQVARAGYDLVTSRHLWRHRASDLHAILHAQFPQLRG